MKYYLFLVAVLIKYCAATNVLLIIADDLGYGDVGIFGNSTLRTPNIDRIGKEGIVLTQHLTAAPVCTPSRAAFFTGKYPIKIGMASTNEMRVIPWVACSSGLPANQTTIARIAQENGYYTALIGKWHLGLHCSNKGDFCHHPLNQGFDYFYGGILTLVKDFGDKDESVILTYFPKYDSTLLATAIAIMLGLFLLFACVLISFKTFLFLSTVLLLVSGIVYWIPHGGTTVANSMLHRNFELVEQPIRFEKLTQRLVWESEKVMQTAIKRKQPFFLVVSWFQVHTFLYNSVPEFVGRSKHGMYGDNVEEMDWSVGQLLNALDKMGLSSDTLVYFTSDNGGHVEETNHLNERAGGYNKPWSGGKLMAGVDGGIRVPTAVRWPGRIPSGSHSNEPTSQLDLYPTLEKIMAVKHKTADLDGHDLMLLLKSPNTTRSPHDFLFHYCGTDIHAARWRSTTKLWKMRLATPNWNKGTEGCDYTCACHRAHPGKTNGVIYHDPPLIFDLDNDPTEVNPIVPHSAQYKEIAKIFNDAIVKHQNSLKHTVNQFAWHRLIWLPWLQPCCNFPYCNCRDSVWDCMDSNSCASTK